MTDRNVRSWSRGLATMLLSATVLGGFAAATEPDPGVRATDPSRTDPVISAGIPFSASETDERQLLRERLAALAVYSATFTQQIHGSRGEVLERSTGHIWLQRPKFKWVVEDPFPQTIVSDGSQLKLYDPDLEQLTLRPLTDALADTPVSLLTRDDVMIGDQFGVLRLADAEGESWLIQPRGEETLYQQIQLHFRPVDSGSDRAAPWQLFGLDILDQLGQRTEIRFEPESAVSAISDATFQLVVPADTDVIGE